MAGLWGGPRAWLGHRKFPPYAVEACKPVKASVSDSAGPVSVPDLRPAADSPVIRRLLSWASPVFQGDHDRVWLVGLVVSAGTVY